MSALSFSLRGKSPTFSGLQSWLQGCAAFPHLLQETPPHKLFNPYSSVSCAQAPPPPGSHPPLRLRRVGGPSFTPSTAFGLHTQLSTCQAGSGPFAPPPAPSAHTGRPGPIINHSVSFEARHGTGASTDGGKRREEGRGRQAQPHDLPPYLVRAPSTSLWVWMPVLRSNPRYVGQWLGRTVPAPPAHVTRKV